MVPICHHICCQSSLLFLCSLPEEGGSRMHMRNIIVVHVLLCVCVCVWRSSLEKNISMTMLRKPDTQSGINRGLQAERQAASWEQAKATAGWWERRMGPWHGGMSVLEPLSGHKQGGDSPGMCEAKQAGVKPFVFPILNSSPFSLYPLWNSNHQGEKDMVASIYDLWVPFPLILSVIWRLFTKLDYDRKASWLHN